MAFLDQAFDVSELPQSESNYDLIPPGWYTAKITKAEVKATKNGTGQYIAVRYDIVGPSHQGRVVFGNLNIKNANPAAENIGREQLGQIMRAIGLARVTDSDQLVGGDLQIKVAIREAKDGYEASNDIKGFKAVAGGSLPTPAPAAQASSAPPWAKK